MVYKHVYPKQKELILAWMKRNFDICSFYAISKVMYTYLICLSEIKIILWEWLWNDKFIYFLVEQKGLEPLFWYCFHGWRIMWPKLAPLMLQGFGLLLDQNGGNPFGCLFILYFLLQHYGLFWILISFLFWEGIRVYYSRYQYFSGSQGICVPLKCNKSHATKYL